MNHVELKAARCLLFLSQTEATRLFGVNYRTYRRWEGGRDLRVPDHVAKRIHEMLDERNQWIDVTLDSLDSGAIRVLIWYDDLDDWTSLGNDPRKFRMYQSVVAEVASETGTTIVPFYANAYRAWLRGRPDSDGLRHEWAVEFNNFRSVQ